MIRRMRRVAFGILLAVALASCGGSDDGLTANERALQGTWIFATADGASGFTFDAHGYVFQTLGPLSDGSFGTEAETGTFATSASTITFRPEQWSCTGLDPAYSFTFSISPSVLTLSDGTAIATFSRDTSMGTGGSIIRIGCWQSDGTFLVNPLAPVPR